MIRKHPITGEPILFAPERAARPHASESSHCPFCPGHEHETPPAIATVGEPWRVRVFANKYPPVDGAEVIVESPRHEDTFASIEHGEEVVRTYVERYRAHADAAYTSIFKNEGERAGSSIAHVHSQVVPVPFTPSRIARELESFQERCPLCDGIEASVIREGDAFTWLAPAGSWMAYQQWIVPKRHVHEMSELSSDEIQELALLLHAASAATLRIGDSYNWSFMNFPRVPAGHCYVDLFPRLAQIAGFELGTGTFVEIIDPAAAAARLRG